MAEISLYQRSQLPPSRTGAVKPLDLPNIGIETAARFAGGFLDKLTKVRAGNEQSEFMGAVSVAQEKAAAAVADNPGMSFEDIKKIQKQMLSEIDEAGKIPTLPQSKNYAKNFALQNRGLIEAKFNTEVEEIVTGHEISRFQLERARLITERKPDELEKLYSSVSGTLLDPETATLSFKNDMVKLGLLQESEPVYAAINAKDYEMAHELTTKADLPEKEKTRLHNEIDYNQARNENNEARIQKEIWDKNETELWKAWREGSLSYSQIESGDFSKRDRDIYTGILDAEREAGVKRKEAEEKILEAKDKAEAGRLIVKGINADPPTVSEFIIGSAAEAYDFSPAEYEGYLKDLQAKKTTAVVPYETMAELIGLITGVQAGRVEPDEVKSKINEMMRNSISAGLPKDEAVTLGLKYREKLAAAIKAGEENRSGAYLKTKGRNLMEELIRDKDPISGSFTDDQRQILATAEAIIRLENYIDDASKTDKPLEGTELLIKAIEIGRDAKKMIKEEETAKTPTIFRPIRRTKPKPKESTTKEIIPPEKGKSILEPPDPDEMLKAKISKENTLAEWDAYDLIEKAWNKMSKELQNAIHRKRQLGMPYIEIAQYKEVMKAIESLTK